MMDNNETFPPFSVVMSVYNKDNPDHFDKALSSITIEQTLKPNEVVLVVDGPIGEMLNNVILKYQKILGDRFRVLRCEHNEGHGAARRRSVSEASNGIIAVMDSDDIAHNDRFEKEMKYLSLHPECDVVGGQITEFVETPENIVGRREVPCENGEIRKLLTKRCPLNHMTVMMSRPRLLAVGNYLDWHFNEDYYLWIRMAEAGYRFANLHDTLVNVRVGKEMYQRRGGWKYFMSEKKLQDYMLRKRIISFPMWTFNVAVRFGVQVVLPNKLRGFIFQKLFRKQ